MRYQFDVLIIGGGIFGSAIFYNLLKNTELKVALLEKNHFAHGATGSSGGLLRTLHPDVKLSQLALEGLSALKNYQEELGISCGFKQSGFYTIIKETQLSHYQDAMHLLERKNVKMTCYSCDDIKNKLPHLSLQLQKDELMILELESGYADPKFATAGYLTAGRNLGGLATEQVDVQEILTNNRQVVGVKTSLGIFKSPCVVVAAGAWTSKFLNKNGIDLPELTANSIQINYYQHTTAISVPPFLDKSLGIYGRDIDPQRTLLGLAHISPSGDPDADNYLDKQDEEPLAALVKLRIPEWREAQWCGGRRAYDAYTSNNFGINQFISELSGLFVCSGWSGIGFKFAPPCASAAAKEIAAFLS